jgi:hypothetical protein
LKEVNKFKDKHLKYWEGEIATYNKKKDLAFFEDGSIITYKGEYIETTPLEGRLLMCAVVEIPIAKVFEVQSMESYQKHKAPHIEFGGIIINSVRYEKVFGRRPEWAV